MEVIGKSSINPFFFYTGKIAGYFCWIFLILHFLEIKVLFEFSFLFNVILSKILFILGLIVVIFSFINLGSSTRLGLPKEKTSLKTQGIYKVSRNPMYLGFNLWTISSIIYFLNISILFLGLYSLLVYHMIIKGEESFLEQRFGQNYQEYKRTVRRYL